MVDLLRLNEAELRRLGGLPQVVSRFPFMSAAAASGSSGCKGCQPKPAPCRSCNRGPSQPTFNANVIYQSIAAMSKQDKRAFLQIVQAKAVQFVYNAPSGRSINYRMGR